MEKLGYWYGVPTSELSRGEFEEAFKWALDEISRLQKEVDRMRPHVDWAGYLCAPEVGQYNDQKREAGNWLTRLMGRI